MIYSRQQRKGQRSGEWEPRLKRCAEKRAALLLGGGSFGNAGGGGVTGVQAAARQFEQHKNTFAALPQPQQEQQLMSWAGSLQGEELPLTTPQEAQLALNARNSHDLTTYAEAMAVVARRKATARGDGTAQYDGELQKTLDQFQRGHGTTSLPGAMALRQQLDAKRAAGEVCHCHKCGRFVAGAVDTPDCPHCSGRECPTCKGRNQAQGQLNKVRGQQLQRMGFSQHVVSRSQSSPPAAYADPNTVDFKELTNLLKGSPEDGFLRKIEDQVVDVRGGLRSGVSLSPKQQEWFNKIMRRNPAARQVPVSDVDQFVAGYQDGPGRSQAEVAAILGPSIGGQPASALLTTAARAGWRLRPEPDRSQSLLNQAGTVARANLDPAEVAYFRHQQLSNPALAFAPATPARPVAAANPTVQTATGSYSVTRLAAARRTYPYTVDVDGKSYRVEPADEPDREPHVYDQAGRRFQTTEAEDGATGKHYCHSCKSHDCDHARAVGPVLAQLGKCPNCGKFMNQAKGCLHCQQAAAAVAAPTAASANPAAAASAPPPTTNLPIEASRRHPYSYLPAEAVWGRLTPEQQQAVEGMMLDSYEADYKDPARARLYTDIMLGKLSDPDGVLLPTEVAELRTRLEAGFVKAVAINGKLLQANLTAALQVLDAANQQNEAMRQRGLPTNVAVKLGAYKEDRLRQDGRTYPYQVTARGGSSFRVEPGVNENGLSFAYDKSGRKAAVMTAPEMGGQHRGLHYCQSCQSYSCEHGSAVGSAVRLLVKCPTCGKFMNGQVGCLNCQVAASTNQAAAQGAAIPDPTQVVGSSGSAVNGATPPAPTQPGSPAAEATPQPASPAAPPQAVPASSASGPLAANPAPAAPLPWQPNDLATIASQGYPRTYQQAVKDLFESIGKGTVLSLPNGEQLEAGQNFTQSNAAQFGINMSQVLAPVGATNAKRITVSGLWLNALNENKGQVQTEDNIVAATFDDATGGQFVAYAGVAVGNSNQLTALRSYCESCPGNCEHQLLAQAHALAGPTGDALLLNNYHQQQQASVPPQDGSSYQQLGANEALRLQDAFYRSLENAGNNGGELLVADPTVKQVFTQNQQVRAAQVRAAQAAAVAAQAARAAAAQAARAAQAAAAQAAAAQAAAARAAAARAAAAQAPSPTSQPGPAATAPAPAATAPAAPPAAARAATYSPPAGLSAEQQKLAAILGEGLPGNRPRQDYSPAMQSLIKPPAERGKYVLTKAHQLAAMLINERLNQADPGSRATGLYGPPGTGKNELAEQMAIAMEMPYYSVDCSNSVSSEALTGGEVLVGGETKTALGPVAQVAASGGVVCINEVVSADPSVMTALHDMVAERRITVNAPGSEARYIPVHPDTVFVFTWNPGKNGEMPGDALLSRIRPIELPPPNKADMQKQLASTVSSARGYSVADSDPLIAASAELQVRLGQLYKKNAIAREVTSRHLAGVANWLMHRRVLRGKLDNQDHAIALKQLAALCDQSPGILEDQKRDLATTYYNLFNEQGTKLGLTKQLGPDEF